MYVYLKRWLAWLIGWELCDFCSKSLDKDHSEIWFGVNDSETPAKMKICSRCWSILITVNSKDKKTVEKMKEELE
jgi:hypothetical protein